VEECKINLKKDGIILFLGNMNAMPMMYALELKKLKQEVIYFVDCKKEETLHRPENHFKSIKYPYEDWIIEINLLSHLLISMFPKLFKNYILHKLPINYQGKKIKAIFFGGNYISLATYFSEVKTKLILSYGADLEYLCNKSLINEMTNEYTHKSFTKYLNKPTVKYIIRNIIEKNFKGAIKCNYVLFFPKGFSKKGDYVLEELSKYNVEYIERSNDMYLDDFLGYSKKQRIEDNVINIMCAVRFHFDVDANSEENKGNDIIIRGLAKYIKNRRNKTININFFEKGPDVQKAKQICIDEGIEKNIIWNKETSLDELLNMYESSDVCFDQVGNNWLGAIGIFAIILGIPLITNIDKTENKPPVLNAKTIDEIYNSLLLLENKDLYNKISLSSSKFAKDNFTPMNALNLVIK
jgi:hypothetical protein